MFSVPCIRSSKVDWFSEDSSERRLAASKCQECPMKQKCFVAAMNHPDGPPVEGVHGGYDFTGGYKGGRGYQAGEDHQKRCGICIISTYADDWAEGIAITGLKRGQLVAHWSHYYIKKADRPIWG